MKELEISITHIKILETISELNKRNMYPLSDGVYKIVAGIIDEETMKLMDISTFSTLVSFNSKKVCRYLLALKRYGYIKKIYNKEKDNLFYITTQKGEEEILRFHKRHKRPFIKKQRKFKETILKI